MAQKSIIEWYRGDAGNIVMEWTKDRNGLGTYSDLTGKSLIFTVRPSENSNLVSSSTVSFQLSTDAGQISFITASMGSYQIMLSSSHTESLSIQDYQCDVQASSTGSVATIFRGVFRLLQDITF